MKLIPYKNVFEFDIPNRVEYEQYKHTQLQEFRDYIISKPEAIQYIPNIYGKVSVQRGAVFPFFIDVISAFYNSRISSSPYCTVIKAIYLVDRRLVYLVKLF